MTPETAQHTLFFEFVRDVKVVWLPIDGSRLYVSKRKTELLSLSPYHLHYYQNLFDYPFVIQRINKLSVEIDLKKDKSI